MARLPFVSVIIPTHNRPAALVRCLAAFARTDYPHDRFEVIVVDDGGSAPLDGIVASAPTGLSIRLLRRPNGGPAKARNTGEAVARGEILAFTDDDCVPHPRWMRTMVATLRRHPDALVGGSVVNLLRRNLFAEASQQLVSYLFAYYNADPLRSRFFTGNNKAMRRDRFEAVGRFDETFGTAAAEDRELCDRWHRLGLPLVSAPRAVIGHRHPLTLYRFARQHWNYGRGAWIYRSMLAVKAGEGVRVEPLSFYSDLLLYPLRQPGSLARRLAICALFFLSQIANAAGFFAGMISSRAATRSARR